MNDANAFPPEHPFYGVTAVDGFHVVRQEYLNKLFLSVIAYSRGRAVPVDGDDKQLMLATIDGSNPQKAGEADRLLLVLSAVAQYFTTGGTWAELEAMLKKMRKAILGGVVFPGYHLVKSFLTDELAVQHIYADDKETGDCVVWLSPLPGDSGFPVGGFIGPAKLVDIKDQDDDGV